MLSLWYAKGKMMQKIAAAIDLMKSGEHSRAAAIEKIRDTGGVKEERIEGMIDNPPKPDARYYLALAVQRGRSRMKARLQAGMIDKAKTTGDLIAIRDRVK